MNRAKEAPDEPRPVWGCFSLTLGLLELLVVCYLLLLTRVVAYPVWFDEYPQYILQYVLMAFLGMGLLSGIVGVIRREPPRRLSISALILSLCTLGSLVLFFRWWED